MHGRQRNQTKKTTDEDIKKCEEVPKTPLCLFYFSNADQSNSYHESSNRCKVRKTQPMKTVFCRMCHTKHDTFINKGITGWKRRRRQLQKKPINLTSFLLTEGKTESIGHDCLPPLTKILEVVKDAWDIESQERLLDMPEEKPIAQKPTRRVPRRLSVPEEIMRKYAMSKESQTEDSEPKTVPEFPSLFSETLSNQKVRREQSKPNIVENKRSSPQENEQLLRRNGKQLSRNRRKSQKELFPLQNGSENGAHQSFTVLEENNSEIGYPKPTEHSKTSTKKEFNSDTQSDLLPGETSSSLNTARSQSLSSPAPYTQVLTSSEHPSSDSDNIKCNCSELNSYITTSTDPFDSGKSTLSQTKSEKTSSTQDSTVSMKSCSTRGSTASGESYSTTSTGNDYHKQTHKELYKNPVKTAMCQNKPKGNSSLPNTCSVSTETDFFSHEKSYTTQNDKNRWRSRSTIEPEIQDNQKQTSVWFSKSNATLETNILPFREVPNLYCQETDYENSMFPNPLTVPRYSALPRTISMVVNTSKETSTNSDSESLTDSLEDDRKINQNYVYDTSQEKKPVRGEISLPREPKKPSVKGNAYFLSIDNKGNSELTTNIYKIPEPPEKIKQNIFHRHVGICKVRKIENRIKKVGNTQRLSRKNRTPKETEQKTDSRKEAVQMVDVGIETETESTSNSNRESSQTSSKRSKIPILKRHWKPKIQNPPPDFTYHETASDLFDSLTLNVPQRISRRSPTRFQQLFEMIPEERSSSLTSSTEEICTRTPSVDAKLQEISQECVMNNNLQPVTTQIMSASAQQIPFLNQASNTDIIIISPKVPNSIKGREALLAVSKDDFYRLSQGWINFYLLKDNSAFLTPRGTNLYKETILTTNQINGIENQKCSKEIQTQANEIEKENNVETSTTIDEENCETVEKCGIIEAENNQPKTPIRFYSSNVPLSTSKKPLPTKLQQITNKENHENEIKSEENTIQTQKSDSGESQSDSTAYFQPPSPKVPRLPIEECNSLSDYSWSTSDDEEVTIKRKPCQFLPPRRRPFIRSRNPGQVGKDGKRKGNSGWSVTVEGTLEFPRQTPDVQMRLSFPIEHPPPIISQSDSGFVEEHSKEPLKCKKQWTVTVANPQKDGQDKPKTNTKPKALLPNIAQSKKGGKNSKDVFKLSSATGRNVSSKNSERSNRSRFTDGDNLTCISNINDNENLYVEGRAIIMERKQQCKNSNISKNSKK